MRATEVKTRSTVPEFVPSALPVMPTFREFVEAPPARLVNPPVVVTPPALVKAAASHSVNAPTGAVLVTAIDPVPEAVPTWKEPTSMFVEAEVPTAA